MQKVLQGILSFFRKADPPQKKPMRKSRAQSLVEVAIAFPILIMLFGGVVEFGFILNTYLSLVDATRDSARYWSNDDPFCNEINASCPVADGVSDDDAGFYYETAYDVQKILDPLLLDSTYQGRRIILDENTDDVIVSVYGIKDDTVDTVTLWRGNPYHLFPTPAHPTGNYPSLFTEASILNTHIVDAPNAGLLLVEVHYNYHHVLNLPWMTAILPNPLHLQAYTIMPIRAGEPK
jgi:hypothetical protein